MTCSYTVWSVRGGVRTFTDRMTAIRAAHAASKAHDMGVDVSERCGKSSTRIATCQQGACYKVTERAAPKRKTAKRKSAKKAAKASAKARRGRK